MVNNKKQIENIFLLSCDRHLPKNKQEYEFLVGSTLGAAIAIIPIKLRETVIRIIGKKYQYKGDLFSGREEMQSILARLLSDVWLCRHLLVNKEKKVSYKKRLNHEEIHLLPQQKVLTKKPFLPMFYTYKGNSIQASK